MSNETLYQNLSDEQRAKFEQGEELLKKAQTGRQLDDWLEIGEGLMPVRQAVMTVHKIKKPRGRVYNSAFSQMLVGSRYSDEHFDPVERSNLLFCLEHPEDLDKMRADWKPKDLASVCHPTTMAKRLRKYLKEQQSPDQQAKPRLKNSSPTALLKEKEREVEDLKEQLAAAEVHNDDPWFELKQNPPEQIADAIVATFDLEAVKAIRDRLTKAIDARKKSAKREAEKQPAEDQP